MPDAVARPITVTARQRRVLEQIVRRATSPQHLAGRARIILTAGDGQSNRARARQLGITRTTVQDWRGRWAEAAEALLAAELEGDDAALEAVVCGVLADAPRSGAPATFTPEQLCAIVALACEAPADAARPTSHWTPREVAEEAVKRGLVARISARTVGRVLKSGRPQAPPEPVLAHAAGG
jgi:homeodomain-containing protein